MGPDGADSRSPLPSGVVGRFVHEGFAQERHEVVGYAFIASQVWALMVTNGERLSTVHSDTAYICQKPGPCQLCDPKKESPA